MAPPKRSAFPCPYSSDLDSGSEELFGSRPLPKMMKDNANPSSLQEPENDGQDPVPESEESQQPESPKPDPKKPNKKSKTLTMKTSKNQKTPSSSEESDEADPPHPPKPDPNRKRVAEKDQESSRAKKKLVMEDKEKKPLFQRLWSEEDELVMLRGLRDYVKKRGKASDALVDMHAFHCFIKKNLHVDASTTQLQDKLRRLRNKFLNNVAKDGKNKKKKPLVFSKQHEQMMYDLSKEVWGLDGKLLEPGTEVAKADYGKDLGKNVGKVVADNGRHFRSCVGNSGGEGTSGVAKKGGLWETFGNVAGVDGVGDEMVIKGLELLEEDKRGEMEEKWRKLRVEEYQLYLMKLNLISEQSRIILDALKGAGKVSEADD